MNVMPNYPFRARPCDPRKSALCLCNQNPKKPTEIELWMTTDEIVEIVVEKIMVIVRAQSEATRIAFEKAQGAETQLEG